MAWSKRAALAASMLLAPMTASAGHVYINGVPADGVTNLEMRAVNITFDANGDIRIDAPHYDVKVSGAPATSPAAQPQQAVQAPPVQAPAVQAPPVQAPPVQAPPVQAPPSSMGPPTPGTQAAPNLPVGGAFVAPGRWWLVTEDNGSTGHVLDIYVGGTLAHTVRSGDPQALVDLGVFLRRGRNLITVTSRGGTYGGGALLVYIGSGHTVEGVLQLADPDIEIKRSSSSPATGGSQSFTLEVP